MTEDEIFIGELARKAGVSIRTIRYYVGEGLLPSPKVRGRYTIYDEEYLNRILLIRYLKDAFLPLKQIRSILDKLDGPKVKQMLGQYEKGLSPVWSSTDAPSVAAGRQSEAGLSSAVEYITSILSNRPSDQIKEYHPPDYPHQAPWIAHQMAAASPIIPQKTTPSVPEQATTWQRIPLANGIELHVSESALSEYPQAIQQLIALANRLIK